MQGPSLISLISSHTICNTQITQERATVSRRITSAVPPHTAELEDKTHGPTTVQTVRSIFVDRITWHNKPGLYAGLIKYLITV